MSHGDNLLLSGFPALDVSPKQKREELSLLALSCVRVGRQGFEPWALGLKVPCSAN